MKVQVKNKEGKLITGALISTLEGRATFVPAEDYYGPNRISIERACISISSEEDDNCIMVKGYIRISSSTKTYSEEIISFYPIK